MTTRDFLVAKSYTSILPARSNDDSAESRTFVALREVIGR